MSIPTEKIKDFEKEYLLILATQHSELMGKLSQGILNDEITATLEEVAKKTAQNFAF
jgi:F-type H+-transporting ATPase subunit alpha